MATLFLDENMPKRLAAELRWRGRGAISIYTVPDLPGMMDPALLPEIRPALDAFEHDHIAVPDLGGPFVIVTCDDRMPLDHPQAVHGFTIATIHPDHQSEAGKRETVHRWAHRIADQRAGSIRRYSPNGGGRPWAARF